jgi:hypothetical protein
MQILFHRIRAFCTNSLWRRGAQPGAAPPSHLHALSSPQSSLPPPEVTAPASRRRRAAMQRTQRISQMKPQNWFMNTTDGNMKTTPL